MFDLCESVHKCDYSNLKTPPEPSHKFEVTLEPSGFTEEKYKIFENYQRLVHHEPPSKISRRGFMRFLCNSPLQHAVTYTASQQEQKLGSYHQCYRLDGRLVAVGVLDLLPQCVSAVYFMYHESVSEWNFGKLSALREAALAKEGGYRYYYMGGTETYAGFYIHSCVKMRYKGEYRPQSILDPETYAWDPLDEDVKRRLDARKYVSLSRERQLGIGVNHTAEIGVPSCHQGASSGSALEADEEMRNPGDNSDDDYNFTSSMPGALTLAQVLTTINLDQVRIKVDSDLCTADELVGWEDGRADNPASLKGFIARFAAVVGGELMREIVVGF